MYISTRIMFSSLEAATEALLLVFEDARVTDREYSFGSLSARQVFASGLILVGEATEIAYQLSQIEGATRYDD